MSLEDALAKLDKEHEAKKAKLTREYAVSQRIGVDIAGFESPLIHYHAKPLNGAVGMLWFKAPSYSSIATGKAPTRELLRDLLKAHPPLPCVRHTDGVFVSYHVESESTETRGTSVPIFPVLFRVGLNSFDTSLAVEWFAPLGDETWHFQIKYPPYGHPLGQPVTSAERDGHGRITRILEASWKNGPAGMQISKYASGSFDTFPSLVLWWHRGVELDIPSLIQETR